MLGGHYAQCQQIFEDREQTHADYPGLNLLTKEFVTCSLHKSKQGLTIVVYGWNLEKQVEFSDLGPITFRKDNDWMTVTSRAIVLRLDGNVYEFDRTIPVVDWGEIKGVWP